MTGDLTEKRVEAIARILDPSAWREIDRLSGKNAEMPDHLIYKGVQSKSKAARIIAADPATTDLANAREVLLAYDAKVDGLNALLERAAEVLERARYNQFAMTIEDKTAIDALLDDLRARAE